MAVPLREAYQKPTPLAPLVIPPHSVARRALEGILLYCLCDSIAVLGDRRRDDAKADAYLRSVERLALLGQQRAAEKRCGCEHVFKAIVVDNGEAQTKVVEQHGPLDTVIATFVRWAGAIEKLLMLRKGPKGVRR